MSTTTTRPSDPGIRRAIWGLVNDGYGLVAKTPNLTGEEAFELCRVPDIGDPSAYLDEGIAFLRAPKWGYVLARYYTNAERDSAGRASLVYDVVALSADALATLRNDPFVALPPSRPDRRPDGVGELPIPVLAARDEADEARRLAVLLGAEDPETLRVLLSTVLAGDRVLWVTSGLRAETLECLTLLLPPALRAALTFQAPTVDYPRHTPRLTVAERAHALLVEREWSAVLPRDGDDPRQADARAAAERLLALARRGERTRRAWAVPSNAALLAGTSLLAGVERLLRATLVADALHAGDLRRAVLATARAADSGEGMALAAMLIDGAAPEALADALGEVVRGDQRGAWRATQVAVEAVADRRDRYPDNFERFVRRLADRLREPAQSSDDPIAREVRVLLACGAASLDDLELFLSFADASLPWEIAWRGGSARWVKGGGRSTVARLFDGIAARGMTYAGTLDAVTALAPGPGGAGGIASMTGRARARASALALALVRRTLAERAMLEGPERLGALADALLRIWRHDAGVTGTPDTATADEERVIRRLFGVADGTADPRRTAADMIRVLAGPGGTDGGDTELVGWALAAIERAHAGAVPETAVRVAAALLESPRLAPNADVPVYAGRVLLHLAAADAAFVFRSPWLELSRRVDPSARRDLLAHALAWVARGWAGGHVALGALADACASVGAEHVVLDEAAAEVLAPHLAPAGARVRGATEVGIAVAMLGEIATPAATARLADALMHGDDGGTGDQVRLRRLAAAIEEVERVRTEDACEAARQALRRTLSAGGALRRDEEATLRFFLGVDDGSMLWRLVGRLPRLAGEAAGRRNGGVRGHAGAPNGSHR